MRAQLEEVVKMGGRKSEKIFEEGKKGEGGAITCSISRVKQTNTRRQKRALLASRAVCDLSHHDKGAKSENKNRERQFLI